MGTRGQKGFKGSIGTKGSEGITGNIGPRGLKGYKVIDKVKLEWLKSISFNVVDILNSCIEI